MPTAYIVKTGDHYLCPGEDGDVGLTPSIDEAWTFMSIEEAAEAARKHADSDYEIVRIDR
jgi:hypothetical protein